MFSRAFGYELGPQQLPSNRTSFCCPLLSRVCQAYKANGMIESPWLDCNTQGGPVNLVLDDIHVPGRRMGTGMVQEWLRDDQPENIIDRIYGPV